MIELQEIAVLYHIHFTTYHYKQIKYNSSRIIDRNHPTLDSHALSKFSIVPHQKMKSNSNAIAVTNQDELQNNSMSKKTSRVWLKNDKGRNA
jgi:hypothetical protein